jgi:hypothetical protein
MCFSWLRSYFILLVWNNWWDYMARSLFWMYLYLAALTHLSYSWERERERERGIYQMMIMARGSSSLLSDLLIQRSYTWSFSSSSLDCFSFHGIPCWLIKRSRLKKRRALYLSLGSVLLLLLLLLLLHQPLLLSSKNPLLFLPWTR